MPPATSNSANGTAASGEHWVAPTDPAIMPADDHDRDHEQEARRERAPHLALADRRARAARARRGSRPLVASDSAGTRMSGRAPDDDRRERFGLHVGAEQLGRRVELRVALVRCARTRTETRTHPPIWLPLVHDGHTAVPSTSVAPQSTHCSR